MVSTVTGLIGILVAAFIVMLMRKDRLHVTHGMSWVVVAVGFALLGFAPGVIDRIALSVGVAYPPILALTFAVGLLVIKILMMDVERSRIETRNQRLIQKIAMLEADIKALKKAEPPGKNP